MAKNHRYQKISPQTQEDSLKVARATQRPGQTKEQTKLIAQGIEKGINQYKKQQKEKSRELSRKLQKVSKVKLVSPDGESTESQENTVYKQSVLPWLLLFISWLGFSVYFF
jgi:hypothetical protein